MLVLYDKDYGMIGPVDYASGVGYTLRLNELGQAEMTLPDCDPLRREIEEGSTFAELWDGDAYIGAFRVADSADNTSGGTRYAMDSAECTLLDDMLAGWHEIGGTGMPTREVLSYILNRQTVKRWVLGRCDFTAYYQYNFEDVTLLEAIMSLGEVITEPYQIQFDTSVRPWTVNFVRLSGEPEGALVYGRNMPQLRRRIGGPIVTRLYGRGHGEGDNQLTIAAVNGGKDYLDAGSSAIERWGIRTGVHVDTRQQDPATLKAHMRQILERACRPQVTYEADALDMAMLADTATRPGGAGLSPAQPGIEGLQPSTYTDRLAVGMMITVLQEDMEPVRCRVTELGKRDIDNDSGKLSVRLDNGGGAQDIAEQLNEVMEKIGVQQLYSQGATSMYALRAAENADSTHPLTLDFYIPQNVLRINKCILKWQTQGFRTDFKMTKSDGSQGSTSGAGGGATVTAQSSAVSQWFTSGVACDADGEEITHYTGLADGSGGQHSHKVNSHHHRVQVSVTVPGQMITLDDHTHSFTIPAHSHELEYGIFTGGQTASSVSLKVDGNDVEATEGELDIAPYLSADDDGKIRRAAWHKVELQPNGNARIVANLFVQQFLQSRGAGDY